jgi:hypothetical protein
MKCSYAIEPHQIQGGDFIHIFPVVQWLVKRVFERRAEIGDFNRAYTLNQYEKQFNQIKEQQPIISFKQNIEAIRVKFSTNEYLIRNLFRFVIDRNVVIDV